MSGKRVRLGSVEDECIGGEGKLQNPKLHDLDFLHEECDSLLLCVGTRRLQGLLYILGCVLHRWGGWICNFSIQRDVLALVTGHFIIQRYA